MIMRLRRRLELAAINTLLGPGDAGRLRALAAEAGVPIAVFVRNAVMHVGAMPRAERENAVGMPREKPLDKSGKGR